MWTVDHPFLFADHVQCDCGKNLVSDFGGRFAKIEADRPTSVLEIGDVGRSRIRETGHCNIVPESDTL